MGENIIFDVYKNSQGELTHSTMDRGCRARQGDGNNRAQEPIAMKWGGPPTVPVALVSL